MRKVQLMSVTAILLVLGLTATFAADKAEAPKAVTAAIVAAFPDAKIVGAKQGHEGIDIWEVDFEQGGKKLHGDVSLDGTLIETEEHIEAKDLPGPALESIKKAAGTATIKAYGIHTLYASVDKAAKTATKLKEPVKSFEADLEKDGKTTEVGVTAEGKIVQAPAWE